MKLCLTIGVSKAPPLSYLPGAITVANEMGDWARNTGFVTEVITDENNIPVTIDRIKKILLKMLPINDEVELFILHFAGHGFRDGAEQNIWLPSDWHQELRAISVEALKSRLYRHGIKSLSIFGDACRSLPSDIETADICGDPVLPRGPYEVSIPAIARFNAVVDGQQAYMLKGDNIAPSRCVFSTVLLEGLCGLKDEAFDKYIPDSVIPDSLASFSSERLKEISEIYDLNFSPDFAPGFPRDHAIYFLRNKGAGNVVLPKWPEPRSKYQLHDKNEEDIQAGISGVNTKIFKRHVLDSLFLHLNPDMPKFNLAIRGAVPKKVWSTSSVERYSNDDDGATYYVDVAAENAVQILVEFEDAVFASAVVYADLTTVISRDISGGISWACTSGMALPTRRLRSFIATIENLQAGNLTADKVDNIAAQLRSDKHANPTLGAISSYLYDYTGDVDSIRRMAYFYIQHNQPIPFDVAFMGLLSFKKIGLHETLVKVPSVKARARSDANDMFPRWVTGATHERMGVVAGLWPWLRQGWVFMDEPEPQEKAVADEISNIATFLLPSPFTSFSETGGRMLIEKFHMEVSN